MSAPVRLVAYGLVLAAALGAGAVAGATLGPEPAPVPQHGGTHPATAGEGHP